MMWLLAACSPVMYVQTSFRELNEPPSPLAGPLAREFVDTYDHRLVPPIDHDPARAADELGVLKPGAFVVPNDTWSPGGPTGTLSADFGTVDLAGSWAGSPIEADMVAAQNSFNRSMATSATILNATNAAIGAMAEAGAAILENQRNRIVGHVLDMGVVGPAAPEGTLLRIHWQSIQTKPNNGSHFFYTCAALLYEGVAPGTRLDQLPQPVAAVVRGTHQTLFVHAKNAPAEPPPGYLRPSQPGDLPDPALLRQGMTPAWVQPLCRRAVADLSAGLSP